MCREPNQGRSDAPAPNTNQEENGYALLPIFRVTPQLDLYESDDEYLIVVDLPGARAESLKVRVAGRELELRAERGQSLNGTHAPSTAFERRMQLPGDVDANSAKARLKDGVLDIRIAKAASARRVKVPIR
jgi:HSP20 family protein